MAKSIRNVMAAIKPEDQINGLTETEIRTEFMKAGYGVTKAAKRTNELKAGAFIQSNGTKRDGEYVFVETGKLIFQIIVFRIALPAFLSEFLAGLRIGI